MRPLIVVDIGNSKVKVGVYDHGLSPTLAPPDRTVSLLRPNLDFASLTPILPAEPAAWCVSSVQRETARQLAAWIGSQRPGDSQRELTYRDVPIPIAVDFPARVGMDRLAAGVAANRLRDADRPAIVVNAGSAITVDLVSADGAYQGGSILPGIAMASRALNANTDLLPWVQEISPDDPPPPVGKSTDAAIRSGLFWGTVGAVKELVQRVTATVASAPQIFISGGDGRQFISFLPPPVTYRQDLVLLGAALMVVDDSIV